MKKCCTLFSVVAIICIASVVVSCKVIQKTAPGEKVTYTPLKKLHFMEKPFSYDPNIKNFTDKLVPPFKIKRFIVANKHNPQFNDTIYKFLNGKSELFVYKTRYKQELFFAGNIYYKDIVLRNGVRVGMGRDEFFNAFTDLKQTSGDTVKIKTEGPGCAFKFAFKKEKINSIHILYYID